LAVVDVVTQSLSIDPFVENKTSKNRERRPAPAVRPRTSGKSIRL